MNDTNQIEVTTESFVPSKAAEQVIKLEEAKRTIDAKLSELKTKLLQTVRENDVISLKTENYTITRAKRTTIKITNHEHVKNQLESKGHEVVMKQEIDMRYMKPLVQDNIDDLEGVEKSETEYLTIRINKK